MEMQVEEEDCTTRKGGVVLTGNGETEEPTRSLPAGQISMVTMSISEEDYATQYWPKLQVAIEQLLNMTPGTYIPLSYEQMYSCVYKCVCKQFSERLYHDLLNYMSLHCERLYSQLQTLTKDHIEFVRTFARVVHHYLQSLHGIVPIFNYMNRFYVESKLKLDLLTELQKLFAQKCVNGLIGHLLDAVEEVRTRPFTIDPPQLAVLIRNLFSLNPEYASLKPDLFAKYIPNILPPTSPDHMEKYIAEVQEMQKNLRESPDFVMCARQKRAFEEDATTIS